MLTTDLRVCPGSRVSGHLEVPLRECNHLPLDDMNEATRRHDVDDVDDEQLGPATK